MLQILVTVLGIGFLLFIHELGHFLAARLAKVRVEVFSLGFGPRLVGWHRGGTDYRIALVPLGGYVRMAGEEQARPPLPDELGSRSVRWRFLIFSGGILMNFLFALVTIPVLFRLGVPLEAPVVGPLEPGGPAWEAGLQEGDRILSVNGREIHSFRHLVSAVALSGAGEPLQIALEGAEGGRREVVATPVYDEAVGARRLGLGAPWDPGGELQVRPGSPAAEAGLRTGDHLQALNGTAVASPAALRVLLSEALSRGGPLQGVVLRDGETVPFEIHGAREIPEAGVRIGLAAQANRVKAVRGPLAGALEPGDVLLSADGEPVGTANALFAAAFRQGRVPALQVRREGRDLEITGATFRPMDLLASLWLVPEAPEAETGLRVAVTEGAPAWKAGLRTGDLVLHAGDQAIETIQELALAVQAAGEDPLELYYRPRDRAEPQRTVIRPEPQGDYGLLPVVRMETVRADSLPGALALGLRECNSMAMEVFGMVRRLLTGEVAARNLGGIITIGTLTHSFAGRGWIPFLFFLAFISINLGVINLLPVPALDGGHLLFLLIEKLRGRPLGERAQIWFNVVGFAALLSLIVFVTWMDIQRLL